MRPVLLLLLVTATGVPFACHATASDTPLLDPAYPFFATLPDANTNGEPELFINRAAPVATALLPGVACDGAAVLSATLDWSATFGRFAVPEQRFAGPDALCEALAAGNTYTSTGNIGFPVLTVTLRVVYGDGHEESDSVVQTVQVINGKD
ncbi:MAG: hypothetical protein ABI743_10895 [bacterium]